MCTEQKQLSLDAIKLLQDSYLRVWQIFMAWFTWFFNINLLALGWILITREPQWRLLPAFAALMILMTLIAFVGTAVMWSYSINARKLARRLLPPPDHGAISGIFAEGITNCACIGILLSLFSSGVVWFVYAVYPGMLKL